MAMASTGDGWLSVPDVMGVEGLQPFLLSLGTWSDRIMSPLGFHVCQMMVDESVCGSIIRRTHRGCDFYKRDLAQALVLSFVEN